MCVGLYAMSFTLPVFLQSNLRMSAQSGRRTSAPSRFSIDSSSAKRA